MRWDTRHVASRAGALGAAWLLGKVLKTPKADMTSQRVNVRLEDVQKGMRRAIRRGSRNLARNRAMAVAGAAALAIGTVLIAAASKKKG